MIALPQTYTKLCEISIQNIPIVSLGITPFLSPSEFNMNSSSTFNAITMISPMFVRRFLFKYCVEFLHEAQKNALSSDQVLPSVQPHLCMSVLSYHRLKCISVHGSD
jgi:hypothetical protein